MDNMTSRQRKMLQRLREQRRYIHVSQYYTPVGIEDPVSGVVTTVMQAQFRDANGKAHGDTYNVGRNAFKRTCKRLGLSRVQVERRAAKEMRDAA